MSAESAVKNLINGNVTDAKRQAKRHSWAALEQCAFGEFRIPLLQAAACADYLKNRISWEDYCKVDAAARNKVFVESGQAEAMAAFLHERREQDIARTEKAEAAACDPAAVFGVAASLDAWASRSQFKGNVSEAYQGADNFMRAIMSAGERFETWACAHVAFEELTDVWPYLLQDKFAEALEAARPGGVLILGELGASDWAAVAAELKLTLNAEGGK